jgi:hypothetical protein
MHLIMTSLAQDALVAHDRSLLVTDPRRCEPKKYALPPLLSNSAFPLALFVFIRGILNLFVRFGGRGARARYQKSYR